MSRSRRAYAWLGAVLLLALCVFAHRVAQRGRFVAPYSTYGAGLEGTRALFEFTQSLGFPVQRLSHEFSRLPTGTLVVLADCRGKQVRPLLRPEREALTEWVTHGGLLIVAGAQDYLLEDAGISLSPATDCPEPASRWLQPLVRTHAEAPTLQALPVGPPLTHALPFRTRAYRTLRTASDSQATQLLQSSLGPLAVTTPMGRGRLVVFSSADMLTNRDLAEGGAVVVSRLLRAFAPRGPVYFDEFHLGMGERRALVGYLREQGYGHALIQACMVGLAYLVARASRLGTPRPLPAETRTHNSLLDSLAQLYARSRDVEGAVSRLADQALSRLAKAHRAPPMPRAHLATWFAQAGLPAASEAAAKLLAQQLGPSFLPGEDLQQRVQSIEHCLTAGMTGSVESDS